jgi:Cap4 dsDNA endonuclease
MPFTPIPIREQIPKDNGGVNARIGFAFQDHVAAKFCLDMVTGRDLAEVWCETYDDIVLVWSRPNGSELIEFAQVKNVALPQLYSPSVLLEREKQTPGTSLFERSLNRDICVELVRFRLVTSREINAELQPLTLDRDDETRKKQKTAFDALLAQLMTKPAATFVSPKNNGLTYWIERVLWEVHSEDAVSARNELRLLKFLEDAAIPVFTDTIADLYQKLLWRVKTAAEKRSLTEPAKKILLKEELAKWLRDQSAPLPTKGTDAKLRQKLFAAKQPDDAISTAIEMRRQYNQEFRKPSYLTLDDARFVTNKVSGVLHQLRAKMDGGELPEGEPFYRTCVDRAIGVKDDCPGMMTKPPEGMLLGCMYEIASRCRHRFVRPTT